MSEERLQELKDSVDFQYKLAKAKGVDNTLLFTNEEEELIEEIERLNNIINELEKYCNEEIEEGNKALGKLSVFYNSSDTESYVKGQQAKCKHILEKLQELKGDSSND